MLSLISRAPLPPLYQSAALVPPFGGWTGELIDRREQEAGTVIEGWHDEALLRTLTLRSARLSIELEVGRDCLIGRIIPAQRPC